MLYLNLNRGLLCLSLVSAGLSQNVQPTDTERARADAICARDAGATYKATFDANGKPNGCSAPPIKACFYGPYVDPKTGQKGCCGKGNGVFSTDAVNTKEGGCCVEPKKYSFEPTSGKGGCCDPSMSFCVDPGTGTGSCCGGDDLFTCECACKANPNPTCPKANGRVFTAGGKKYKLFCGLINHGDNDLLTGPATSWADCMEQCSARANCVRAIYDHNSKTCYLRSHGNKDTPVTAGVWDSAHLIEAPIPAPLTESPKTCPEAEGKIVRIGGVDYQMFCDKGYSERLHMLSYPSATDINDCLAKCSAEPKCQGANYWSDSGICVMTDQHEFPPTGTSDPNMITFVPLKMR